MRAYVIQQVREMRAADKFKDMTAERGLCIYCGQADDGLVISGEGVISCQACRKSKGDSDRVSWFKRLRDNDPIHWDRIVENHRLGSSSVSNLIRTIRIDT